MIATDGVFSMDGSIADLKSICDLADEYDALVMVDDSHAAVSYTHLDVYKRQTLALFWFPDGRIFCSCEP